MLTLWNKFFITLGNRLYRNFKQHSDKSEISKFLVTKVSMACVFLFFCVLLTATCLLCNPVQKQ